MLVEITNAYFQDGIFRLEAIDCDTLSLMKLERNRVDDGSERTVSFELDTHSIKGFNTTRRFLKSQKVTAGARTYGEAASRIIGTVCEVPKRFRIFEQY